MKTRQHRQEHRPLMRAVHVFLLLGWLLSSQGVAPAICLMAANLDGEHAVKVGASGDGGTTVVLSHKRGPGESQMPHKHDLLCDLLMVFAISPPVGELDHVLAFRSVDNSNRATRSLTCDQQALPAVVAPVLTLIYETAMPERPGVKMQARTPAWFPGLALKTDGMIMLC